MKKLVCQKTLVILILSGSTAVFAQEKKEKKEEIHIRTERIVDGKKQITEKIIDTSGMTEEERQNAIEAAQDSAMIGGKSMKRIKVTIDDEGNMNHNENIQWNEKEEEENGMDEDVRVYRNGRNPRVKIYKRHGDNDDWEEELHFKLDGLNNKLRYMGDDISRRFDFNTPVYRWDDQLMEATNKVPIRGLDVFPNRPQTHILNIRFFAPQQNDVVIKVLDINGKIVAEEKANDFEGEYVGQITLKKDIKGTFFVIVSQGEDGVSQRVVL